MQFASFGIRVDFYSWSVCRIFSFSFSRCFQPLLPCSESRSCVQNFCALWLLAGCEWGATLAVDQRVWAVTLRMYSRWTQTWPIKAAVLCSGGHAPLGSHRLQLKHLRQCLVTALSNAGSREYYQNNLLIKPSWAFFLSQKDRWPPWQGLSDDLQEREQSQDVCEVLNVLCKADVSMRGSLRIGQSSWYNSLGWWMQDEGFQVS